MKVWKHFKTITKHKNLVLVGCFKVGLYKQGLLHDMSKYGPTEFWLGCKYYQGDSSPHNGERKEKGYSTAWLHHKGRNKHHLEYWIDYGVSETDVNNKGMVGLKMPICYVAEMLIDRVSASKNYQGKEYTNESALAYYEKSKAHYLIHEDTKALIEYLLTMLAVCGEQETYSFVKHQLLKGNVPYNKLELERRKEALHVPG